jgi:hypothetical protein
MNGMQKKMEWALSNEGQAVRQKPAKAKTVDEGSKALRRTAMGWIDIYIFFFKQKISQN